MAPIVGIALDLAIIATSALWLGQHPQVQPFVAKPGLLVNYTTTAWNHFSSSLSQPDTRIEYGRKLYDFVLGDDLGSLAASNPNLKEIYELNEWKNSLLLPQAVRAALPHTAAMWLRNYVAIHIVYFGGGALWCLFIYHFFGHYFFPASSPRPSWQSMKEQMWASTKALPFYVLMPTAGEWLAEKGWTRAFLRFEEVGGFYNYLMWTALYLFFVEWAIYWVHRGLHDVKWLYLWLHWDHHIYNKAGEMSPFAGLAFHPLDGMAQAAPYLIGMFLMPVHFWTHQAMLFFTGVWTTNIHDALVGNTEPVMGSKYHTYHHVWYKNNYGQIFVFFDWIHDTLTDPESEEAKKADAAKTKAPASTPSSNSKAKAS